MKIKIKLRLGIGSLFFMILVLATVGVVYINQLKNDIDNILHANYLTLEYSRNMLMALDETLTKVQAYQKFDENLKLQQNNISEIGEQEATDLLAEHFKQLKSNPLDKSIHAVIRHDITNIMKLNMQAIQNKSNVAKITAQNANIWIGITGTVGFLAALILLLNLPDNIANPIQELTSSIKQIAARNYTQRVYFQSKDEFGELATSFNRMAEKLEEYNSSNLSKLLFEKKRIETLINNMHDPVIGLDQDKKILFVNDEALKVIGMKSAQLIGKYAPEISVNNDLIRLLIQDLMTDDNHKEKPKNQSVKIFADEKESYFDKEVIDIIITPTGEDQKRYIGYVILLRNITPFKELDFAKTNFIATVSHELKTPISAIKLSLQLLESKAIGNVNEEQKQLISSIKDDSNRLLNITSELLQLTQLETGNFQLDIKEVNPQDILKNAMDSVHIQAEQSQIQFDVSLDPQLPSIKSDPEKTTWVLINLLTNAIKHSPEMSEVEIEISNLTTEVMFSVKDNGRGVESRYQSRIFDRYFQIAGTNKSGSGLGLAISKKIIEAQGGTIGVESEIGMGSKFYFKIPV